MLCPIKLEEKHHPTQCQSQLCAYTHRQQVPRTGRALWLLEERAELPPETRLRVLSDNTRRVCDRVRCPLLLWLQPT
eukprot:2644670-Rhodomonas_salina.1